MRAVLAVLVGLSVSGCGAAMVSAARGQMEKDTAACEARPRSTQMALAQCVNAAEHKAYIASGISDGDLVAVRLAARLAIAEKVDRGQMTKAEADLEFAKTNVGLVSAGEMRQQSSRQATAEALAAFGPSVGQSRQRSETRCTAGLGGDFSCTTY